MSELHPIIGASISDHVDTLSATFEVMNVIEEMAERCKVALATGNKILFQKERRSLAAIALTTDTSILTAVGNDYGFEDIFSRQVEGLGRSGDILIGISTSGNSKNVVKAVEAARNVGMHTFAFTGKSGGKLAELCDLTFAVPSKVTARIQEMHILAGHILCELVEEEYA